MTNSFGLKLTYCQVINERFKRERAVKAIICRLHFRYNFIFIKITFEVRECFI